MFDANLREGDVNKDTKGKGVNHEKNERLEGRRAYRLIGSGQNNNQLLTGKGF